MKIELKEIPIAEVAKGYVDSADEGVMAYEGKLNVRPAYQREFIYKDKQRDEVINTIRKAFPLNVMYWVVNESGGYEVLDGQQRTISFCQYINGDYSINYQYFHNLEKDEQQQILDYKLMVYICEGSDKEKLDWFKIINIAGEKLTDQELRNAIYTGEWLTDAKRHFSKNGCPAYMLYKDCFNGSAIRQDYLEAAISWIAAKDGKAIEEYMAIHQHDKNANELWLYTQSVMNWVKAVFPHYRREMKGIDWGLLFNEFGSKNYDTQAFEKEIVRLMSDDDVSAKNGIYAYLLDGREKHLSIRAFTQTMKSAAYERQKGICPNCHKHFELEGMEADHITPWHTGGKTTSDNCQMLCKECNRRKSGI
ncbi:MAG TPA: DUF262 domain-containing protein [Candidatus Limiplasma sp.]|nr:DUF262 domain-containing protein [Candidatus Limiplasma sp.]